MPKNKKEGPDFDSARVKALMTQIKNLKRLKDPYDIVGRAGKLELPLALRNDKVAWDKAFHCALAELCSSYENNNEEDLNLILKQYFDPKTNQHYINDRNQVDLLGRNAKYTRLSKKKIISITYPWFNQWLYLDLHRITRVENLRVSSYTDYPGKYRYFRSFPEHTAHKQNFRLTDGYITVEADIERNMLVFGHTGRTYHNQDICEHRGFVLPTNLGHFSLISFREGIIRLAIVKITPPGGSGLLLTASRETWRPFVAKFLIVKEGKDPLFHAEIPVEGKRLVQTDPTCEEIVSRLKTMNENTAFKDEGFMWAGPT